jgi:hypothetical protein
MIAGETPAKSDKIAEIVWQALEHSNWQYEQMTTEWRSLRQMSRTAIV